MCIFKSSTISHLRKRYFSTVLQVSHRNILYIHHNPFGMSGLSIFIWMRFSRGVRLLNAHTALLTAFKLSNSTEAKMHYLSLCHCSLPTLTVLYQMDAPTHTGTNTHSQWHQVLMGLLQPKTAEKWPWLCPCHWLWVTSEWKLVLPESGNHY